MSILRPAVFLDRDGVLNEIVERDGRPGSPRSLSQFRPVSDLASVQRLKDAGLLVFIITNQPDVARGHITHAVLDRMLAELSADVAFDDYRVCPHDDADGCECRKPKPGMILDLARHWHVDRSRSFVVGDMWRDVEAARSAGCEPVLIRRPYNRDVAVSAEAGTLADAVAMVLSSLGARD
jgi:D-glycero-D-manno-heptose 1,7-bisphosphate phosphatase